MGRGFTLVEILVVIAIILVLGALIGVGIGKAQTAAYKAESISNIRQLSSVTLAGATDNNGDFPEFHASNSPYWFTQEWRDDSGITREMAYSSANKCWKRTGMDICSSPNRNLWDWEGGDAFSVFGYISLVNDTGWADGGAFMEPDNWEIIRPLVSHGQEIRWVPERMGQEVAYPILWMDLTRQWGGTVVGNFMRNEREPKGTHVGYMDGHVEWVDGNEMQPRWRGSATIYW